MTPKQIRKIPGLGRSFGVYDRGLIFDRNFIKPSAAEIIEVYNNVWDHLASIGITIKAYQHSLYDCENFALSVQVRVSEAFAEKYPGGDPRAFATVWGEWQGKQHSWNMAITESGLLHFNYGSVFTASDANCKLEGGIFI